MQDPDQLRAGEPVAGHRLRGGPVLYTVPGPRRRVVGRRNGAVHDIVACRLVRLRRAGERVQGEADQCGDHVERCAVPGGQVREHLPGDLPK